MGRDIKQINYAKLSSDYQRHHARFESHVMAHGLTCQECGGLGGEVVPVLETGEGPFERCGWCEGTGRIPKWLRGSWLRSKKHD